MTKQPKESLATKKNRLWNSYKGIFKQYNAPANFKEPVLILMRRGKKTELFENATAGEFEFKHTDGEIRKVMLHPGKIRNFPNGKRTFEGYICHEDDPQPLPQDPVITAQVTGQLIDKTLHDVTKWKTSAYTEKGQMWYKIFTGLAILGAVYVLYVLLKPAEAVQQTPVVAETVKAATAVTIL